MRDDSRTSLVAPGKWYVDFDINGNAIETVYDKSFRELLGFETEEEFSNTQESWNSRIHPEDRERVVNYFNEIMASDPNGKDYDIEYRIYTKWGYHWFHDYAHINRRKDGSVLHFEGVSFDIQHIRDFELEQEHDKLRKEVVDYIVTHEGDPIDLLGAFAEKIRTLLDCDQIIYRDLEKTRIMANSQDIEKTWSVPEEYCRQCQHFDAHHPMYADGYTEMDNCQEGWKGIPVYSKCPIKSSLTRIVKCNGKVAGYMAVHYVNKYHHFTDLERKTVQEFADNFALVLSRYESEKRIQSELEQNNKRILALGDLFESLYDVDMETGSYNVYVKGSFYQSNVIDKLVNPSDYFKDLKENIETVIYKKDRKELFKALSRDTIIKNLEESERYEYYYRIMVGKSPVWFKVRVVYKDETKRNVIIGVFNAEKEMEEKLREQDLAQRTESLVNSLVEKYKGAFIWNLDDGTFKVGINKDLPEKQIKGITKFGDAIKEYVARYVHPEDVELFDAKKFRSEDLKKYLEKDKDISFEYRSCTSGEYRWMRITLTRISESSILVGMEDCDEEITERIVSDRLLGEYDAIYILNLAKNEIYPTRSSRVSKVGAFQGKMPYDKVAMKFAETVAPIYKKDWIAFSSVEYLKRYLANDDKREYVYELPGTGKVLRRVTFDILERKDSDASLVLMSFVGIDDVTAKSILLQKSIAEQDIFTSYFLQPYEAAYYLDLETHRARIYKHTRDSKKKDAVIEDFFNYTRDKIQRAIQNDDREEMLKIMDPDFIKKLMETSPTFRHTFRDNYKGRDTILQLEIVKGADGDHVAIGFKDVTKEWNKEKAQQVELQKAYNDAKEANLRNSILHKVMKSGKWSYGINEKDEVVSADYEDITTRTITGQFTDHPMHWVDFLHPEDKERVVENFMAAIHDHSGETPYDSTFRILGKDGKYHYAKSTGRLLRHEDGTAELFGMNIDITEQIEKERQQQQLLEEALSMAQSANRAKTTFLNNMSHDIRTPMNAIIGYTGLAASHIENKELVQDYLSKISQSSDHLLSLINDVLDMSRIESGKMNLEEKEENLSDIIHTLRDISQASIHSKQLDFFVDAVDVNDEDIICDKLRLNQVLLNILSNAIKYTPAGGTVALRVKEKTVKESGYGAFEFIVKDNGIGMDKEFLKTIFDPFTRVKSSTVSGIQGTGLGMAITKNIIDMMGGKIDIQSEPNNGTEVSVTFDFKLQSAPKAPVEIPEFSGVRGLVVDDDASACIAVAKMLKDIGMRDEWCTSGKEAIIRADEAYQRGDLFKVYIIDWLMPDMNGIETTRRIRKVIGDDAPIIILTAYDWSDIEEEAREAGVTAFVSKPMFPSDLHRILTKCLGQEVVPAKTDEKNEFDLSGKKVLLVEDNELNREIATAILEEYGCTVFPAEDGDIAVAKMKAASAGDYDLVLMDVQMPTIDGYEATRQIRTLGTAISRIPILAMTANAFEEDRKAALAAGMNEHIAKPINIEKLKETLAKFL